MGRGITAQEDEALVNSGAVHAKNLGFVADARLAADVRSADPRALLAAVAALRVVTHAPSANYCTHQHRTAADCAGTRTVGLLAQEVARVVPGAVSAPASITLGNRFAGPHHVGRSTGGAGSHGALSHTRTLPRTHGRAAALAPPVAAPMMDGIHSTRSRLLVPTNTRTSICTLWQPRVLIRRK